ncbi:MAG: hypothetical protein LBR76_02095 [Oscillospiraceae bacterium]|jgi:alpha-mannosidase|nr:hypothetical protein [Oscillospiraceae bacterium]
MEKSRIHIVPHTHWDREWYYSLEKYRYRLIPLMDSLLDSMEKGDIEWFVADGHTLLLRDYLDLRPENRPRLEALVRAGRLLIGPWFTQPNTFMSCGEAQVQNLLAGRRDMESWGGGMTDINYQPDQFGFHAQLPQMMKDFGMTHLIGARGMPKGCDTLLRWEGADGTVVGVCALINHYISACGISDREEEQTFNVFGQQIVMPSMPQRMDHVVAERPRSLSPNLLGMNGVDHMRPNPYLPAAIAKINERYAEAETFQSNFRRYIDDTEASLEREPATVRGELKDGRPLLVLTGAQSGRMDVKMYNRAMERLILRRVEPLMALMSALGEANLPYASYDQMWDILLQNHAHDSLCCSNSETSYYEVLTRYDKINDIGREICNELEQRLVRRLTDCPDEAVLIRNPSPVTRGEPVTLEVIVAENRSFAEPHLFFEGREVPAHVLGVRNDSLLRYVPFSGFVGHLTVSVFTMTIDPGALPPLGYKLLEVRGGGPLNRALSGLVKAPGTLENEFIEARVEADGTLTVTDKRSGQVYSGLNTFIDDGEAGDGFIHQTPYSNYSAVSMGSSLTVDIVENNPLQGALRINQTLSVPASLSEDRLSRSPERVDIPISTTVTLKKGSGFLEFETEIDNKAKDHRLRAAFPSDTDTGCGYAGQPFDAVTRPVQPGESLELDGNTEPLVGYHPMEGFCGITDGTRGLALAADSIMEYEILPMRNTVCLTLFRATDRLLSGLLKVASEFRMPAAQLLGTRTFRYAFIPHTGGVENALGAVEAFNNPLCAVQRDFLEAECMPDYRPQPENLPVNGGFVSVEGGVTFSRLKPSENREGVILRLYNPSGETRRVTVRAYEGFTLNSAEMTKMDESAGEALAVSGNAAGFEMTAKKIVTLRLLLTR